MNGMSKSKQTSMSKLDSSLLSLIILTLEFLVLVVIHNSESKRYSINVLFSKDDKQMSMYFVKQGDISESNKPELYPPESKQLPDSKSGLSQFRKTLERPNYG